MNAITLAAMTDAMTATQSAPTTTTEKATIEQVRAGNQAAFSTLIAVYEKPVFRLCLHMLRDAGDAEDAAQETFLRAYLQIAGYDPARPFKTWLMAIAGHYCIDRLRRKHATLLSLDDELLIQVLGLRSSSQSPEDAALMGEQARCIQRALARLPAETGEVVTLRYWGQLSCAEIADATGSSVNAIKSRLHRARQALAGMIDPQEICIPYGTIPAAMQASRSWEG